MTFAAATRPHTWQLPTTGAHAASTRRRVLVGRQGIFRADFSLAAYEMLFRAPGRLGLRIDLWNSTQQDRATEHVIAATFHRGVAVADGVPAFINFTRGLLLSTDDLWCDPDDVVIEVVETAFSDEALRERLSHLRGLGFRVAVDDFIGTRNQQALLAEADFVKIDLRDFVARGADLISRAHDSGAELVAERIESRSDLARCVDAGFTLFQGHALEPSLALHIADEPESHDVGHHAEASSATRRTARSTAKPGERAAPLTS
jgi:EAL and modified HD-GYP domain-containing signal transduction protein